MPDLYLRQHLDANRTPNLVLDDRADLPRKEATSAEVFYRFEDEPGSEPQFLGTAIAGQELKTPFNLPPGRKVRFFLVSRTETGDQNAPNAAGTSSQLLLDQNTETVTPQISQYSAASNTSVQIFVNGFSAAARHRKIELSPNADMSASLEVIVSSGNLSLPEIQAVMKGGESAAQARYIRVSHSSNGVSYSPPSNILPVTFADSAGAGGSGGGGFNEAPCFVGNTTFTLASGELIFMAELSEYVGQRAKCFDAEDNETSGVIEQAFAHLVYEYLLVSFADGVTTGVTKEHPYYTELYEYIAVGKLNKNRSIFDGNMNLVGITGVEKIYCPGGVWVYNARIGVHANYLANNHRVHNAKSAEF